MNIQYIKSNISNTSQDNLIKLLYDLILQDIKDVTDYKPNVSYRKGDRVYLEENGKHQIYQCIVDMSSKTFIKDEWIHVMEVFDGSIDKVYSLKLHEEVHYIDENTTEGIITKLDFNKENSTVAIYKGKKRYTSKYDFTIDGKNISFNHPFNVGDRLILEVREKLGTPASFAVIFYDLAGNPYEVVISNKGILAVQKITVKRPTDVKYTELVTGDHTYTMLIDTGANPPALGLYKDIESYITGTDNKIYKLVVSNDQLTMIEEPSGYSDTKIILGSDRKFYTLALTDGVVTATLVNDPELKPSNFDLGVKVITNEFKNRMIDIKDGVVRIRPYIANGGFHNIAFKSKGDNNTIFLSVSEDLELSINDNINTVEGKYSQILDYFYFFDNDWNYYRMYFENSELYYETCEDVVIPDSRGINILTPSGEMTKLILSNSEGDFSVNRVISLSKTGTFESPIEGFVMMVDNVKKMITVNRAGDGFDIRDTDEVFRTNHHYIMSEDKKIYKLAVEDNNVRFIEFNSSEFDVECVTIGAFIKSNEIITRFDIQDGNIKLRPISTFMHRIKSDDGKFYIMDIKGKTYNETISFREIHDDEFTTTVGAGELYFEDVNGEHYKANIDIHGNLHFTEVNRIKTVDYEVTSLVYSTKGWYKLTLNNGNLTVDKIFDNLYDNRMSYGNIVKKDFIMTSENKTGFSLYANGNGELDIKEVKPVNVKGLVLRSSNGFVYGLGVMNEGLVSYESYITNPRVPSKLYLYDTVTKLTHSLFMTDDRLCSEVVTTNAKVNSRYSIYDVYQKEYYLKMVDGCLIIEAVNTEAIDGVFSNTGEVYRVEIIDNRNGVELVKEDNVSPNIIDYINSNGSYYSVTENSEGLISINQVDNVNHDSVIGEVDLIDSTTGYKYNLVIDNGNIRIEPIDEDFIRPIYIRDINNPNNLYIFKVENGIPKISFFGIDNTETYNVNKPGFITVQDSVTGLSYKGYVINESIELERSQEIYTLEQFISTNDGMYIVKLDDGVLTFNSDSEKPELNGRELVEKLVKSTRISMNDEDVTVSMGGVEDIPYKEEKVKIASKKEIYDIIGNLMSKTKKGV